MRIVPLPMSSALSITSVAVLVVLLTGLAWWLRRAFERVELRATEANEQCASLQADLDRAQARLRELDETLERQKEQHRRATADLRREVDERALTEQMLERALDASEDAVRAKHEFLANMSHEIRTPLNGVLGMVEILESSDPEARERRQIVRAMQTSGQSLLRIIDDILDLSKLEAGKVVLERREVDLHELVEDVLASFAREVEVKGLELSARLDEAPRRMLVDPVRLRQILVNLLGNAIKFTHRGEVAVRASALGSDRVRFTVRDTGIGIAPAKADTLFEAFGQADSSTTREYGGTGLGLTICRRLTGLMGGRLDFESVEGEGTSFELEIEARSLPETHPWLASCLAGQNLLLVEPAPWAREAQAGLFAGLGARVESYDSLAGAVRAIGGDRGTERNASSGSLTSLDPASKTEPVVFVASSILWPSAPSGAGSTANDRASPSTFELEAAEPTAAAAAALGELGEDTAIYLLAPGSGSAARRRALALGLDGALTKPLRRATVLEILAPDALRALEAPASTTENHNLGSARLSTPDSPLHDSSAVELPPPLADSLPLEILVVEDNPVNQMVADEILRVLGYAPELATNGIEALDLVVERARPFDLVLMDMMMPLMDGLEATRRIRAALPAERQPRIVALTANVLAEQRRQCRDAGMDGFLAKPMRLDATRQLLQKVEPRNRTWGDRRRPRQEGSPTARPGSGI